MRLAFLSAAVACGVIACVAPGMGQSNGAKMGEALAFAAAAGAVQVAESVAEQNARNNAPVTHASGLAVTQGCDDAGQYACVTVTPSPDPPAEPEPDLSDDDARDYVLGYVNGVRKIHHVAPLVRDDSLDAFAQAGSDALAQDHALGRHLAQHSLELRAICAELQGSPQGSAPGPLQDQIAEILLHMMDEGPGGMHHDMMLRPDWRKLGVGILKQGGRMYFTVDFSG
jgi:uncharacterized protein YkwD